MPACHCKIESPGLEDSTKTSVHFKSVMFVSFSRSVDLVNLWLTVNTNSFHFRQTTCAHFFTVKHKIGFIENVFLGSDVFVSSPAFALWFHVTECLEKKSRQEQRAVESSKTTIARSNTRRSSFHDLIWLQNINGLQMMD